MIGLDTNVFARYYVEDKADRESELQRDAARRLIESGAALAACKTVLLELEWVIRGYYAFPPAKLSTAMRHLLSLKHVDVEDRKAIEAALSHYDAGLDFADALHHASYRRCERSPPSTTRSSRGARSMGVSPSVVIPR